MRKESKWMVALILLVTTALYVGVIFISLRRGSSIRANRSSSGPQDPLVEQGANIFEHTRIYAPQYTDAGLSCGSCHAGGGRQLTAVPMTGVDSRFPKFSLRAGRVITLRDRIRECFVRSENGKPPEDDSSTMKALLSYLASLSKTSVIDDVARSPGLPKLPNMRADPSSGQAIYISQCSGCHGAHGEGAGEKWPPLWGPRSFNNGAGMYQIPKLAAFVEFNMPQNRMGILTPQQAYDVAAYVHEQSRPTFNSAYAKF